MIAYKIRAFPNKNTEKYLLETMNHCRILYNNAIIERRNAYKHSGKSLSYFHQCYHVKTIREDNDEYRTMDARLLYTTLKRVHTTYQKFFDTQKKLKSMGKPLTKKGKMLGYPTLKKRDDFRTITYEKSGWQIDQETKRFFLTRNKTILGKMRILTDRPIEGVIKTVTVTLSPTNKWWLVFTCEDANKVEQSSGSIVVGLDFGVKSLVTDSDGKTWDNPRYLKEFADKIAYWQKKIADISKVDPKRPKYIRALNRVYEKLTNKRQDLAREIAAYYSQNYDVIHMEDVNVTQISARAKTEELSDELTRNMDSAKNKQTLNASIGNIRLSIKNAAQRSGKITTMVKAAYTSQTCSSCGSRNSAMSDVSEREFICPSCGERIDRDINAAKNILRRGNKLLETKKAA